MKYFITSIMFAYIALTILWAIKQNYSLALTNFCVALMAMCWVIEKIKNEDKP